MFAIDIHESTTSHVGHTGTSEDIVQVASIYGDFRTSLRITSITATIDATANGDLGLHQGCKQAKQYDGQYFLHDSLFTNHYSLLT